MLNIVDEKYTIGQTPEKYKINKFKNWVLNRYLSFMIFFVDSFNNYKWTSVVCSDFYSETKEKILILIKCGEKIIITCIHKMLNYDIMFG